MAQIFDLTSPSPPSAKKQKIVANNENRERNGTAYTEESQGILGAAATASPAQSDSCDVIDLTQVSPSALLRMTESLGSPGMNVGGTANPFLFSLPIDGSAPASPASPQTDGYGRGGQGSQHSAHGYSCEYYGDDQSYNDYINNQRTQSQSQPDVSELPLCGPEGNDIDLGAPPVLRDEMGVCGPDLSSAESSPAVSRSCVPQRRATARVSRAPRAGGSRLAVPVWDSSDDSVVYSPEPTDAERTRAEHIRTLAEEVKGSQSCVGLSQTSEFIAKLAVIREEQIAHGTSATMPVVSATGIRISLSSSTGVASVSAAVPDVAARTRPSRGTDRSPSNPSVPAAAATAARGLSTTLVRAEAPGPLNRDDNTARGSSSTGSGSAVCGATACVASDVASSTPVAAVPALVPFPPTKLPLLSIPVAERAGYEVLLLIDYREQDGKNIRARVYNLPDGTCIPCAIVGLCLGDYCWGIRRRIPASSAPPGVNAEQLDAHGNDTSNPNPIYMLSAVAERKTIADLVSSIMDGRFLEQKLRLRALGDGLGRFRDHPCAYISQKYYIVEGGTTAYNPNLARRGGAPAKNYYRTGQGQGGAAGAAQAAARAMGGIGSREVKSAIMATQIHYGFKVLRSRSIDHTTEILASIYKQLTMDFYSPSDAIEVASDGSLQLTPPLLGAFVSLCDYEAINKKSTTLNSVASVFAQQLRRSIPNCSAACTAAITKHFPTLASLMEFARSGTKQAFVSFIGGLERGDDENAADRAVATPREREDPQGAAIAALFARAGAKKRQKLGPQFANFLYTFLVEDW